ncbi:hypothetical protein [Chromobacterium violaceum]|uniref:Uncharacterized protein n=1 Tax=Chromobacterium violaceum TaxID=536 RepID=A0AAX2M8Y6_CHRVL|nr:hypothetical protein [Chromobacterium violaceum]OLZ83200.1 hypothetical protein BS642_05790 [Chromobacterium violaceum]STB70867.1 Uncharacterised protein [Chromobacterium violaceum]SUX33000.1 Uncharacterised protein [Chromobacterium violaceum]
MRLGSAIQIDRPAVHGQLADIGRTVQRPQPAGVDGETVHTAHAAAPNAVGAQRDTAGPALIHRPPVHRGVLHRDRRFAARARQQRHAARRIHRSVATQCDGGLGAAPQPDGRAIAGNNLGAGHVQRGQFRPTRQDGVHIDDDAVMIALDDGIPDGNLDRRIDGLGQQARAASALGLDHRMAGNVHAQRRVGRAAGYREQAYAVDIAMRIRRRAERGDLPPRYRHQALLRRDQSLRAADQSRSMQ